MREVLLFRSYRLDLTLLSAKLSRTSAWTNDLLAVFCLVLIMDNWCGWLCDSSLRPDSNSTELGLHYPLLLPEREPSTERRLPRLEAGASFFHLGCFWIDIEAWGFIDRLWEHQACIKSADAVKKIGRHRRFTAAL